MGRVEPVNKEMDNARYDLSFSGFEWFEEKAVVDSTKVKKGGVDYGWRRLWWMMEDQ